MHPVPATRSLGFVIINAGRKPCSQQCAQLWCAWSVACLDGGNPLRLPVTSHVGFVNELLANVAYCRLACIMVLVYRARLSS